MSKSESLNSKSALDSAYKKVVVRLIPFVFLCYIFAYFSRVNVSFAKLEMLGALGFSESVYGLGAGIFFIGYVVFAVPSNIILSKMGARLWIAILMVAWGIFSTCLKFTRTSGKFYLFRFLTGVAEAGFFPGMTYYFTQWFPGNVEGELWRCLWQQCLYQGYLEDLFLAGF